MMKNYTLVHHGIWNITYSFSKLCHAAFSSGSRLLFGLLENRTEVSLSWLWTLKWTAGSFLLFYLFVPTNISLKGRSCTTRVHKHWKVRTDWWSVWIQHYDWLTCLCIFRLRHSQPGSAPNGPGRLWPPPRGWGLYYAAREQRCWDQSQGGNVRQARGTRLEEPDLLLGFNRSERPAAASNSSGHNPAEMGRFTTASLPNEFRQCVRPYLTELFKK